MWWYLRHSRMAKSRIFKFLKFQELLSENVSNQVVKDQGYIKPISWQLIFLHMLCMHSCFVPVLDLFLGPHIQGSILLYASSSEFFIKTVFTKIFSHYHLQYFFHCSPCISLSPYYHCHITPERSVNPKSALYLYITI